MKDTTTKEEIEAVIKDLSDSQFLEFAILEPMKTQQVELTYGEGQALQVMIERVEKIKSYLEGIENMAAI